MKPICKAVGGKSRIYPQIRDLLPNTIKGKYIEPFVGGGAVFFEYLDDDLRRNTPSIIADANGALIHFYAAVANDPGDVWNKAGQAANDHEDPTHYYRVRDVFNEILIKTRDGLPLTNEDERIYAGSFAYLNRACFNGLWRVHQTKGTFNVPRGSYRSIQPCAGH
jgi:DNA adenine methylase